MEYRLKEISMCQILEDYQTPAGFRSTYKGVPFGRYAEVLKYIDFTKYYVKFRGPRRNPYTTLKRDAMAFDVYMHSARDTSRFRIEREAFQRGVSWAKDNA